MPFLGGDKIMQSPTMSTYTQCRLKLFSMCVKCAEVSNYQTQCYLYSSSC